MAHCWQSKRPVPPKQWISTQVTTERQQAIAEKDASLYQVREDVEYVLASAYATMRKNACNECHEYKRYHQALYQDVCEAERVGKQAMDSSSC